MINHFQGKDTESHGINFRVPGTASGARDRKYNKAIELAISERKDKP